MHREYLIAGSPSPPPQANEVWKPEKKNVKCTSSLHFCFMTVGAKTLFFPGFSLNAWVKRTTPLAYRSLSFGLQGSQT